MAIDEQIKSLASIVDNGTLIVTVPTPEGWKCGRCGGGIYHTHSTYHSLALIQKGIVK